MRTDDQSKLRVLMSGVLPPPVGGIGVYCESLLKSSLPQRVDLRFVQTTVSNRPLSQSGCASIGNVAHGFCDCMHFARELLAYRPNVCQINTAYGLSFLKHSFCTGMARLMKIRVLILPHCGFGVLYENRTPLWKAFVRRVLNTSDGLLAISREWLQFEEILPGYCVHYMPNAIDISKYQPANPPQAEWCPSNKAGVVLYMGYLGQAKGTYELIKSAHLRRANVVFDLVGDEMLPGELARLRRTVSDFGLDRAVRFHKVASGDNKLAFFQRSDIFIYPSHSEGMPLALIEAMACGLPIIATRVGGLPDLVQDGVNGFLVDSGSPEQLASAIDLLASDPQLRHSMGLNSRCIAATQFCLDKYIDRLVEVYLKTQSKQSVSSSVVSKKETRL